MTPTKFKTISFKAGTYVFVEEQINSSEFYIVKQGSLVEENPLSSLTGEQESTIHAGDFFGVLECMSQRPRLSSIKVLEDTILIVVRFEQFETLITQMAPIALKIIRYFSNKLRKYNIILTHLSTFSLDKMINTTYNHLFQLGQYYQQIGETGLSCYAYTKFITNHPSHINIHEAQDALKILNYDLSQLQSQVNGIQQTYEARSPIFLESEVGTDLYIIIDGCVKITKLVENREVLLGMLKEKDIFGEMAILENSPRSATAIASTKVTVLRINKQNFELYIRTHPEIARRIIQLLSDRIWLIYKRLANQLITDPVVKIYDALQTLLQKNRIALTKGVSYSFDMTPEDIIQFIGLDPATGKKYIDQILANDPVFKLNNGMLLSTDIYSIRSASTLSSRNRNRSHVSTS